MKVQIIRSLDAKKVMSETNSFIKDKKVIDIKFEQMLVPTRTWLKKELEIVSTVFIMYEN